MSAIACSDTARAFTPAALASRTLRAASCALSNWSVPEPMDWMKRNFFRRIEVAFPVERRHHRRQLFEDLELYLTDNCQAWVLQSDGNYLHEQPGSREAVAAQTRLMQTLTG